MKDLDTMFFAQDGNKKNPGKGYFIIKRLIDIIGVFLGLIIFSPVMLTFAIAIRLDSKGSVIFSQTRVAKGGKTFEMSKFRSMIPDAEKYLEQLKDKKEK